MATLSKPKPGMNRGGGYEVFIANDGLIKVKPGDSLSKYSMAMYGDFNHIHEFARRNPPNTGPLRSIENVNYIQANESIYHMPTATVEYVDHSTMSKEEIRIEVERLLRQEYGYSGTTLMWATKSLSDALFYGRMGTGAGSIGVVAVDGLCVNLLGIGTKEAALASGVTAGVGTLAGVAGVVLGAVAAVINLILLRNVNVKHNGLFGVAYAVVAYVFEDNNPPFPQKIRDNLTQAGVSPAEIQLSVTAFHDAVNETFVAMLRERMPQGVSQEQMRLRRRLAIGKRKALGDMMMQDIAKRYFSTNNERGMFLDAHGMQGPYITPPNINMQNRDRL